MGRPKKIQIEGEVSEDKIEEETAGEVTQPIVPEVLSSIDGPGVKCDIAPRGSKAYTMLASLALQPKIRTRIPREAKEPQGALATVILNGLRINIVKGVSVDLPEQVSDIIDSSYYQTEKAINDSKVTNPLTGRQTPARVDLQGQGDQEALNA